MIAQSAIPRPQPSSTGYPQTASEEPGVLVAIQMKKAIMKQNAMTVGYRTCLVLEQYAPARTAEIAYKMKLIPYRIPVRRGSVSYKTLTWNAK